MLGVCVDLSRRCSDDFESFLENDSVVPVVPVVSVKSVGPVVSVVSVISVVGPGAVNNPSLPLPSQRGSLKRVFRSADPKV